MSAASDQAVIRLYHAAVRVVNRAHERLQGDRFRELREAVEGLDGAIGDLSQALLDEPSADDLANSAGALT